MSHTSPAVYLVWSILSGLLNVFLLFHLWSFDRFQCLKWNSKAHAGAFKRFMTYTYLLTVPMVFVFSLGNAIIKYREGFVQLPFAGIIPRPWQMWSQSAQATIFPFTLLFSIAWSFEMVTHLEELCFWLFLVNANSGPQNWFQSPYFKIWIFGSIVAILYMPIVTIVTKADPLQCEAFTFLAGSIGSLSLTMWFTPVLYTFPSFLKNLRREGIDISAIIRLTKFSELNTIRVGMRFLFCVPLLILGVDGVQTDHHINKNMFATDFLAMISALGVTISSGITLVIFFPRSIEGEIAARDEAKTTRRTTSQNSTGPSQTISFGRQQGTHFYTSSAVQNQHFDEYELQEIPNDDPWPNWRDEERDVTARLPPLRKDSDRRDRDNESTERNSSTHNTKHNTKVRMVSNFISPIDFMHATSTKEAGQLAFQC